MSSNQNISLSASGGRELVEAAASGDLKSMRSRLDAGVDINSKVGGDTALHQAVNRGATNVIKLLIEHGADLNVVDRMGLTPLMIACSNGQKRGTAAALQLLQAGADAKVVRGSDEMTALKFAAERCPPDVLQALIDAGAEVDGPRGTQQTALMLAARANNVESLRLLLRNGADLSLPCKLPWANGRTAEGLAQMEKRRKAFEYLKQVRETGRL